MFRKSHYVTLGVRSNEGAEGIRRAFRHAVKSYHPDRAGLHCVAFFQKIVSAYRILADPARRSDYDHSFDDEWSEAESAALAIGGEVSEPRLPARVAHLPLRHPIDFARFGAALARASNNLRDGRAKSQISSDGLDVIVIVSADEAIHGGLLNLRTPNCCPCEQCAGSGREGMFTCAICDGEGLIEAEETVRVHLPPGIGDGALLEVPLRGLGVHGFYLRLHVRVVLETAWSMIGKSEIEKQPGEPEQRTARL